MQGMILVFPPILQFLWYKGKEVPIKKVFHLTHKKNIEKIKEVFNIIPLQILKNCVPQNIPLRGYRYSAKNDPESGKIDLTNFGNLVEILRHRVEEGNRNLQNHVQNAPWMPHVLLFQFRFFLLFLWYLKSNCDIN